MILPSPCPHTGPSSAAVAERVSAITEHHIERLREVTDIVRDCPSLTAYDIAGRMHWDIQSDSWRDFPPTQKWFAVGEALAHIDFLCWQTGLFDVKTTRESGSIIPEAIAASHEKCAVTDSR